MSRRSSRRSAAPKKADLKGSEHAGLLSFCEGNEATIAAMLDVDGEHEPSVLVEKLREIMGVNHISTEQLLARFFQQNVLAAYCNDRTTLSSKGGVPTLAARISKAWRKPGWAPAPAAEEKKKNKRKAVSGSEKAEAGTQEKKQKMDRPDEAASLDDEAIAKLVGRGSPLSRRMRKAKAKEEER